MGPAATQVTANVTEHTPGTFGWAELATHDAAQAKTFYGALFGWTFQDNPMSDDGSVYSMAQLGEGLNIVGLYEQDAEMRAHEVPAHWLNYINVADIEATAAAARRLGGTVAIDPFEVGENGSMSVIVDPTGATVALWQPGSHIGADVLNLPGSMCWHELATPNSVEARRFYGGLFGWQVDQQMGDNYSAMSLDGSSVCGIMQMDADWEGIPPHWMTYFTVEDCDLSARRARDLGGDVKVPCTDIEGVGRFAVCTDPDGVLFSIISLNEPPTQ